ncbi:hypothetical protein PCE1_004902 [Barthelona sp. PCE]
MSVPVPAVVTSVSSPPRQRAHTLNLTSNHSFSDGKLQSAISRQRERISAKYKERFEVSRREKELLNDLKNVELVKSSCIPTEPVVSPSQRSVKRYDSGHEDLDVCDDYLLERLAEVRQRAANVLTHQAQHRSDKIEDIEQRSPLKNRRKESGIALTKLQEHKLAMLEKERERGREPYEDPKKAKQQHVRETLKEIGVTKMGLETLNTLERQRFSRSAMREYHYRSMQQRDKPEMIVAASERLDSVQEADEDMVAAHADFLGSLRSQDRGLEFLKNNDKRRSIMKIAKMFQSKIGDVNKVKKVRKKLKKWKNVSNMGQIQARYRRHAHLEDIQVKPVYQSEEEKKKVISPKKFKIIDGNDIKVDEEDRSLWKEAIRDMNRDDLLRRSIYTVIEELKYKVCEKLQDEALAEEDERLQKYYFEIETQQRSVKEELARKKQKEFEERQEKKRRREAMLMKEADFFRRKEIEAEDSARKTENLLMPMYDPHKFHTYTNEMLMSTGVSEFVEKSATMDKVIWDKDFVAMIKDEFLSFM